MLLHCRFAELETFGSHPHSWELRGLHCSAPPGTAGHPIVIPTLCGDSLPRHSLSQWWLVWRASFLSSVPGFLLLDGFKLQRWSCVVK